MKQFGEKMNNSFTPTELIAVVNQTLEYAYSSVLLVGEVYSYNVNQGKWVFFDLKDEESSVSCFMPVWNLRTPIEDGMKIVARGFPKVTGKGKFSFTVNAVKPVGEGSLKKAYEILKKKLTDEGLFDPAKKRPLPEVITKIGVISSTQAAGYADFIKIINARWGGMKVQVAHTLVQGMDAPDQIVKALKHFNERGEMDVIVIIRGGGSADDLSCFNDEMLVREIASSRIPVVTGIGHEIDETLSDLAADVRASTPSNVAEMLTPDRAEENKKVANQINRAEQIILMNIKKELDENDGKVKRCLDKIRMEHTKLVEVLEQKTKMLEMLNPEKVLSQGYAILSGKIDVGNIVKITTIKQEIAAEIKSIKERN
ncbi:exodeoxyribonuclease VII large subunit [Candidatus Saccharibacteria bacterium]|nr:exodeoxyribonuclease VII large subunit [Candidatus Saccharibacteria bacterium]